MTGMYPNPDVPPFTEPDIDFDPFVNEPEEDYDDER